MKVTTGSNSGCENKLAEAIGRLVHSKSLNDSAAVSLEHLSKGPAFVSILLGSSITRFHMELSEIRNLEGEAFDNRVKQLIESVK